MLKILIAAGGTGGHLFPAQQLRELLLRDGPCEILFAGHRLAENPFFEREKIPFAEISSASLKKIAPFFFSTAKGFWQSLRLIWKFKPDAVVGFGSFHSFPVLLAAAFLRKKIVLFEANCLLGKVNRFFFPFAKKIGLQFPLKKKSSSKEVYVPLLPWISRFPYNKELTGVPEDASSLGHVTGAPEDASSLALTQSEARKTFQLQPEGLTFLIFGGSQGAAFINRTFCEAARLLKEKGLSFQVIHSIGKDQDLTEIQTQYQQMQVPASVKHFEPQMPAAYAAADLAICRSGAGTTAELIRFQKPALLIPFPQAADDHQKINAAFLTDQVGGARLLLQSEANGQRLAEEIERLIGEMDVRRAALKKAFSQNEGKVDFGSLVRRVGERS